MGDIQNLLLGSKFTTTVIPGELCPPGYSFCGPGTNLDKRLDEADNPKPWSKPKNRVDEVCMKHDIDYGKIMERARHWKKQTNLIEKC